MMEDPYMNLDPADFFNLLESNQLSVVEDIKSLIHDHLNSTKEAWLVHGLYDYSFSRSSLRAMEILLGLREAHSKHLLDKLSESLRSGPGPRLSSLIFMGLLVRRQPQWLHKISSHYVMRDLIKVLKTDNDVVILVNALLVLTALIPIIPNLEAFILADIFEGFSRLAAWNYASQPPRQPEIYLLHLQIGLYALFHRLYGMYPCNFLSYLRQHYSVREHLPIFSHTVKPMVETVRMHPLLVTASKDIEIGTARWKQMSVHDIVTECAKYSLLECQDTIQRDDVTCSSSLVHASSCAVEAPAAKPATWLTEAMNPGSEWTWPAQWISVPPASSKVPLSARGLTPKTEPIEGQPGKAPAPIPPTSSSSAARSLNLTPVASPLPQPQQPPTSPMKKDLHHSFKFPPNGEDRRSSVIGVKLQKIGQESGTTFAQFGPVLSGMRSRHSSGAPGGGGNTDNRKNVTASPAMLVDLLNTPPPAKEKDHISAEDREVCRLLAAKPLAGGYVQQQTGKESSSDRDQSHALSQSWVQSREGTPSSSVAPQTPQPQLPSRPDSLLQEKIVPDADGQGHDSSETEEYEESDGGHHRNHGDQHHHASSGAASAGGLHMPDQQLRISDFVQRVKRLRYFSQCLPVSSHANHGSSPGSGSSIGTVVDSNGSFSGSGGQSGPVIPPRPRRKRSNSCPNLLQVDDSSMAAEVASNKEESSSMSASVVAAQHESVACQTDADLWPPTPYEHLFFSVLPPSLLFPPPPPPAEPAHTRPLAPSELLDRYINDAFRNHERSTALMTKSNANEDVVLLRGQVLMLQSQLQFERHRREVHAERNRRLLAKAKGLRLVEEELHTLRLQLAQAQSEMAALRRDADSLRRSRNAAEAERNAVIRQFEQRTKQMLQELQDLSSLKAQREEELGAARDEARLLRRETGKLHACLFEAEAEMAEMRKRASESHRYQQDLKISQYHLIAARETANILQQQMSNPVSATAKFEIEELTRTFKEEVKAQSEKLERERRHNEALSSRLADMEATAGRREADMSELKRFLQVVKEEHQQVMQVAEQKYESIKSINMALENTILELRHQVEISRSRQTRRRQIIHHQQQQAVGMGGIMSATAASSAASPSSAVGPGGLSASPGSPPSLSSISGTSAEQLSVSLAVEASEGLNELYWQGIDNSAIVATCDDNPVVARGTTSPSSQQS